MDLDQRGRIARLLALACVLAGACGTHEAGNNEPSDARLPRSDANPSCIASPTLEIGTCRVAGTADPCTGVAGELTEFVAVADGTAISMVVGPQGATMFVLAIRTSGIEPGDPANVTSPDNPTITITLVHEQGSEMALYRGRAAFEDADVAPMVEVNGLFVVVEGSIAELIGTHLTAHANVVDANGVTRCGALGFVAAN